MTKTTATALTVGRTYYGPNEARMTLMGIDGDTVTARHFLSMREVEMPRAEFEAFVAGSRRRTYIRDHGKGRFEKRVKLDEADGEVTFVGEGGIRTVKRAAWLKWRNARGVM